MFNLPCLTTSFYITRSDMIFNQFNRFVWGKWCHAYDVHSLASQCSLYNLNVRFVTERICVSEPCPAVSVFSLAPISSFCLRSPVRTRWCVWVWTTETTVWSRMPPSPPSPSSSASSHPPSRVPMTPSSFQARARSQPVPHVQLTPVWTNHSSLWDLIVWEGSNEFVSYPTV